ncbi:hypothetical protein BJ508DRAFT_415051 [Ascobolus immersus RN42]|uniref:C2H2-type domain-containing protein n=1 Tax=Ascobolus immersus RN42 TaxID=1160509 RepID=A0A3N4IA71_ASCIM|nr:hypothetical protein BJ508DRAFT_415051 [Ascobolus immersus RN42]
MTCPSSSTVGSRSSMHGNSEIVIPPLADTAPSIARDPTPVTVALSFSSSDRNRTDPQLFPIGLANKHCSRLFKQLLEVTKSSDAPLRLMPEGQDPNQEVLESYRRYLLWADNVGARHVVNKNYPISLDYRLREAKNYSLVVLKFFENMEEVLTEALDILFRGAPWCSKEENEVLVGDAIDFKSLRPAAGEAVGYPHQDIHDTDSWDFSDEEMTGSDLGLEDSESERASDNHNLEEPPDDASISAQSSLFATPFSRLIRSLNVIIDCLYSLRLRKPATIDQVIRNDSLNPARHYKPFDVGYVRDAFPRLSVEVAERLGEMLTRRRGALTFRREHNDRLMSKALCQSEDTVLAYGKIIDSGSTVYAKTGRTKATTIVESGIPMQMQSIVDLGYTNLTSSEFDIASETSEGTSFSSDSVLSEFTGGNPIRYPRRPRDEDGNDLQHFICPFCHLSQHVETEHAWRKHVLKDLCPYVCTYPNCPQGTAFFESRRDWAKHETELHRGSWFCNSEGHPTFHNADKFAEHMVVSHSMPHFGSGNLQKLIALFRIPARESTGICHLCGHSSGRISRHVAHHLEQIALRAIPISYDDSEDQMGSDSDHHGSGYNITASVGDSSNPSLDTSFFFSNSHGDNFEVTQATEERGFVNEDDWDLSSVRSEPLEDQTHKTLKALSRKGSGFLAENDVGEAFANKGVIGPNKKPPYYCLCGVVLRSGRNRDIDRHKSRCTVNRKQNRCPLCGDTFQFGRPDRLKKHMDKDHPGHDVDVEVSNLGLETLRQDPLRSEQPVAGMDENANFDSGTKTYQTKNEEKKREAKSMIELEEERKLMQHEEQMMHQARKEHEERIMRMHREAEKAAHTEYERTE